MALTAQEMAAVCRGKTDDEAEKDHQILGDHQISQQQPPATFPAQAVAAQSQAQLTAVAACVPFFFVEQHSDETGGCSEVLVSGLPTAVRQSVWSLAAEHLGVPLGSASSNRYEVSDTETAWDDDEVPVALDLSLLPHGASVITVTLSIGQPSLLVANTTVVVTVASTKRGLGSVHLDRRKSRGLMVGEGSALPLIPFGAYIYDVDLDGNRAFPRVEAWAPEFGGQNRFPPPEKNELVLFL